MAKLQHQSSLPACIRGVPWATVVPVNEDNSARAAYRRKMQQRQTVLFSSLTATLAVVMVLAMLIWAKVIPFPFEPKFTEVEDPNKVTTPCIADGAKATDLTSITVNVYNATNRTGIAGEASKDLGTLGVTVAQTQNWSGETKVSESARIVTGSRGINAAYTIAQYIPKSVVQYDASMNDETVSVVLGTGYNEIVDAAKVKSDNPKGKLKSAKNCVKVTKNGK